MSKFAQMTNRRLRKVNVYKQAIYILDVKSL